MARHINAAGLKLLMASEGCRLKSYLCPANVWTCGYGATGDGVGPDTVWTQEQANERLIKDVTRFEKAVDELLKVELSENQYSAVICLVYNIGVNAFKRSTLLRLLNQGDLEGSARQFPLWVFAQGRRMPGLVMRRQAEMTLFRRLDKM